MVTVVEEPCKRALDLPGALHDLKSLADVLDDLQVHFVVCFKLRTQLRSHWAS